MVKLYNLKDIDNLVEHKKIREEISDSTKETKKSLMASIMSLKTELMKSIAETRESFKKDISSIELKHGKDGKDGANGKDGLNGRDGTDGKNGADGKDGVDGKDGRNGIDGNDGLNGKPGVGIAFMKISNGDLLVGYTDGREKNLGRVKGKDGKDGKEGTTVYKAGGGYPGLDGKSAYLYAIDGGYTGTEQEFTEALGNIGQGGGHVIQKNGVSFTQRANLNFTGSVTVTDNGTDTTTVNFTGGSGGGNTYFPSGW